jgi:hypothetical protein
MVQLFDHFVCFEHVVNMDEHQDQGHPVDLMLHKVGINPATIPPEAKVVRPGFTHNELQAAQHWLSKGPIGLYQLSSANSVRAFPAADSVYHFTKLVEAFPNIHWLALYDEFVPKEFRELTESFIAQSGVKNAEPVCFANLRDLWALTARAVVAVGPDSMLCHIAGSLSTPCVGLWGPVSPENRVKYYKNHVPIFQKHFCPHAPCFAYTGKFPRYCPPRPTERTTCEVLAGISANDIIEAVNQALQIKR